MEYIETLKTITTVKQYENGVIIELPNGNSVMASSVDKECFDYVMGHLGYNEDSFICKFADHLSTLKNI